MVRRLFAFVLAAAAWLSIAGAAADPVFPTGLRIGLEPPPGMTVSRRFPGFEDADRKAAITLVELPLPAYGSVEKSMFDFTPPGMTIEKREMMPFADGVGLLLVGKGDVGGVMTHHWFLLGRAFGGANADLTALVDVHRTGSGARRLSGHGRPRRARVGHLPATAACRADGARCRSSWATSPASA